MKKKDDRSNKNILVYCVGYVAVKNLSYIKTKSDESNGNKYLMLVPTDENKDTLKKYEEVKSEN